MIFLELLKIPEGLHLCKRRKDLVTIEKKDHQPFKNVNREIIATSYEISLSLSTCHYFRNWIICKIQAVPFRKPLVKLFILLCILLKIGENEPDINNFSPKMQKRKSHFLITLWNIVLIIIITAHVYETHVHFNPNKNFQEVSINCFNGNSLSLKIFYENFLAYQCERFALISSNNFNCTRSNVNRSLFW